MENQPDGRADWTRPGPERLPRPTYWPMVLAAGIVTAAWGLVFSPWFVILGIGLFIVALGGWVMALRQSRSEDIHE